MHGYVDNFALVVQCPLSKHPVFMRTMSIGYVRASSFSACFGPSATRWSCHQMIQTSWLLQRTNCLCPSVRKLVFVSRNLDPCSFSFTSKSCSSATLCAPQVHGQSIQLLLHHSWRMIHSRRQFKPVYGVNQTFTSPERYDSQSPVSAAYNAALVFSAVWNWNNKDGAHPLPLLLASDRITLHNRKVALRDDSSIIQWTFSKKKQGQGFNQIPLKDYTEATKTLNESREWKYLCSSLNNKTCNVVW